MKIIRKKSFEKAYKKCNASFWKKIDEALFLFSKDPFHAKLNNHALKRPLLGLRSVNVTGVYEFYLKKERII